VIFDSMSSVAYAYIRDSIQGFPGSNQKKAKPRREKKRPGRKWAGGDENIEEKIIQSGYSQNSV
jgi:hypothetical protein